MTLMNFGIPCGADRPSPEYTWRAQHPDPENSRGPLALGPVEYLGRRRRRHNHHGRHHCHHLCGHHKPPRWGMRGIQRATPLSIFGGSGSTAALPEDIRKVQRAAPPGTPIYRLLPETAIRPNCSLALPVRPPPQPVRPTRPSPRPVRPHGRSARSSRPAACTEKRLQVSRASNAAPKCQSRNLT